MFHQIVGANDKLVSRFIQDIVGGVSGMSGIFISSIFSASLSTVSCTLNSQAGIIYLDFIRPLNIVRHTETNANRCINVILFIIGTVSIVGGIVIERLGSILQIILTIAGICGGSTVGVFTLGMLYPWANKRVSYLSIEH